MDRFQEVAAELGHTPASAERLYTEYVNARDSGKTSQQISAEGWCGDLIDECSDRYYEACEAYERAMAVEGPTMYERELMSMPR